MPSATGYVKSLLGENEEIIYVTRQHWFVLVSHWGAEIFTAIGIILLVWLGMTFVPPTIALVSWIPWFLLLLIVPIVSAVRDYLIWNNQEYIITSRRVIQLAGVVNKDVTDSSLEKVNDVKMDQSVLGRLFNFGDVEILTASELGANLFKRIHDPIKFKTAMLNAKDRLERGLSYSNGVSPAPVSPAAAGTSTIPALIADLDRLRQQGVLTEEEFQKKKAELLAKM